MDVIAQWVRTVWTKRSRGGPAAVHRNAVASGFKLPGTQPPLVHEVLMAEQDDFKPRDSLMRGAVMVVLSCVAHHPRLVVAETLVFVGGGSGA
ncbi:MAG: hypothetical protein JWM19_7157 [Actinomycetia bacterium]|nr:hypothetical protein [Actinomycetes bacterium]